MTSEICVTMMMNKVLIFFKWSLIEQRSFVIYFLSVMKLHIQSCNSVELSVVQSKCSNPQTGELLASTINHPLSRLGVLSLRPFFDSFLNSMMMLLCVYCQHSKSNLSWIQVYKVMKSKIARTNKTVNIDITQTIKLTFTERKGKISLKVSKIDRTISSWQSGYLRTPSVTMQLCPFWCLVRDE